MTKSAAAHLGMGRWVRPHDKRTRPHPASLRAACQPNRPGARTPATMRPVIALRRCLKHGARRRPAPLDGRGRKTTIRPPPAGPPDPAPATERRDNASQRPALGLRPGRAEGKVPAGTRAPPARGRQCAVCRDRGRTVPLRGGSARRPGLAPCTAVRHLRCDRDRRRLRRAAGRRASARSRLRAHPHHREGRQFRRHLVLEPLSRRGLRHRVPMCTCHCWKKSAPCPRRSTPRRRRSSRTQAIGRHFDLYRDALFQTEATSLRWDEAGARWQVGTDRGDRLQARASWY